MSLTDYLNDTAELMNDSNFLFNSQQKLTRYVNEARRQCAQRTGCIRRLVTGQSAFGASAQPGSAIPGATQPGMLPDAQPNTFPFGAAMNSLQTIPGVERYPYIGFFNPYLQETYAGVSGIIDVSSCAVNWGGAVRPSLAWMPWEDLQAYARAYATLVTSYPYYWSCYNDGEAGEVWMFPAPSTNGDIELDAFCSPKPLYSNDDFDAIPDGFRNSIKFLAASLAYMASGRYLQASLLDDQFQTRIGGARVGADRGKTPNFYYSSL